MQALLSFEQAPPIAAPFRFFLAAPLFAGAAAILLMLAGPDAFVSRWTPAALAATHLIVLGFILQVMVGAMIQMLPVVAGANLPYPLALARFVHAALALGVGALAGAFLGHGTSLYLFASIALAGGLGTFVVVAGRALFGVPSTSSTITGLKLSLLGMLGVLGLGVLLALARGGLLAFSGTFPSLDWVGVHVSWGLGAWGLCLLAAVSYVVVPMFQMTPIYPLWFGRLFCPTVLATALSLSLAELAGGQALADLGELLLVWLAAAFCIVTLTLQAGSRRARSYATQRYWRAAMFFALAGCGLWCLARLVPAVGEWPAWPLLFAVLVLLGGFMSVIGGMLYKIVPFLVWLHLQNRGRGRVMAPNMKQVLDDGPMDRQRQAHLAACAMFLAAVVWPAFFLFPAAIALLVSSGMLAANLLSAVGVYRRKAAEIDRKLLELAA